MYRFFFIFLTTVCCLLTTVTIVKAVYDPLSVPNNKFGVHILEPSEVFEAAKLVNSQGGKWGYVTIPIRTDDRDKDKWTNFMLHCSQNSLLPILRISSYATGANWVSPPDSELTDFANFLNDLPWPSKNRYIIIYNEPNHAQEWGGYVSPSEYATLLITAHDIFKSRSQDFFVLSAGLDMSVPTSTTSLEALRYYRLMTQANKNWYSAIDGISVHAYPNPGFTASVWSTNRYGITSYRYEVSLLKSLGFPPKPLFITETGYLGHGEFYNPAFNRVWTDPNLVAVTPFVLFAGAGDFAKFSLLDSNYQPTAGYKDILAMPKISGSPLLSDQTSQLSTGLSFTSGSAPVQSKLNFLQKILNFFFPPKPTVVIGSTSVNVDVADTAFSRSRGLSGRKSLATNSGMLFKFPQSAIRTFWMNGMRFSLDFIWIDTGRVVNLHEHIPPPDRTGGRPVVLSSSVPVNQVLEVPAGFIAAHGIKIGDQVMLNSL
jgi:uncharacterized membrane protein (UPF0127 family)